MMYYDQTSGKYGLLTDMFDPERNAYLYDQPLSGVDYSVLLNYTADNDPDAVEIYLLTDEAYIEECAQTIRSYGYEVSWEYGEPAKAEEALLQAYVLHTVDQSGAPVPGVYINFCSDTSCTLAETDENGTAAFESAPGVYHVQLVKAPEGYSFDADFDMYTGSTYGEWVVRIRKD